MELNNMTRIGLNMIIKNEAEVLPRLLASVLPIIDYYVIVDTGSTDDSINVVKSFFKEAGINGEIHEYKFTDFGDTRQFALNKLRESGKADFCFLIDADEKLIINKNFELEPFKRLLLNYDSVVMKSSSGSNFYGRRNFFRLSKEFYWSGKTHEVMLCNTDYESKDIKYLEILMCNDGSSWTKQKQREKHLKNVEILEKEVAEKNNPRDIFYLANSYRDAFEPIKAIEWYRKRVKRVDGFYEEIYYSQFMIGNMYNTIGQKEQAIIEWMRCSEFDNLRAEHLLNIIVTMQELGLYKTAYTISNEAVKIKNPYPERILFIDEQTYSGKLRIVNEFNKKILTYK